MNKKILNKLNILLKEDGFYNTFMNEVKFFKTSIPISLTPYIYDNWVVFTFQNSKLVHLNNHTLEYDVNNYLVASSTFPLESQTNYASKEEPMISMIISIDLNIIYQLIEETQESVPLEFETSKEGTFTDEVTLEIRDILFRLVTVLEKKEDSKILGYAILRELFYRILQGKNVGFLYKLFNKSSNEAKISRSLKIIHENFNKHLNIESLARKENISVASFHVYFKKITAHTPLQYIKKIRLTKARDLIVKNHMKVNEVASSVGYDTIPHFSREFKKYYGYSPKDAKVSYKEYNLEIST